MRNKILEISILGWGLWVVDAHAMTPIALEGGVVVDTCEAYHRERQTLRVAADGENARIASEYLVCSESWGGTTPSSADDLSGLFRQLKVLQLPSSLAMQSGAADTFVGKGGRYDQARQQLLLEGNDLNLVISIVRRQGADYLVWVTDEIPSATYRAYYPALVHWEGGVVTVKPFYPGGF